MEWMVYIAGDDFDLRELSKSLTSPELRVIKEENQYYLKSINVNHLNNADEVRSKAEGILTLINGASRLALGTRKPLTTGVVLKINDDGSKEGFCHFPEQITPRDAIGITTVSRARDDTIQEIHQADTIPD
jgi:hypothetical protein